jgi:hypothetical protein
METGVSRREADQGLRCVLDTGVQSRRAAENLMESVCISPYVLRTADTGDLVSIGTRAYDRPVSGRFMQDSP